jgi:hypothetical protein
MEAEAYSDLPQRTCTAALPAKLYDPPRVMDGEYGVLCPDGCLR